MTGRRWLVAGLFAFAACGGRVALYKNVPDGSGAAGTAGAMGTAGATGSAGASLGEPDGGVGGAGGGAAGAPLTADNSVSPSRGCGHDLPPGQMLGKVNSPAGYTQYRVMGTGANLTDTPIAAKAGPRTFWVRVPWDYDDAKPYRVVFIGQGCGAYQSANVSTYHLYSEASGGTEQAIYVALDVPEDKANQDCYDNRDGLQSQEWEAFQLFMELIDQSFCVDLNKIYVVGYSTGSWLANMWGCYFAGAPTPPRRFAPQYHLRAQAGNGGGEPAMQPACGGPVAALWIHDQNETANPIAGNIAALARVGRMNGCDTTYDRKEAQMIWAPWTFDPSKTDAQRAQLNATIGPVCQQFTGCPVDYPVVFCTTTGLGRGSGDARMIPAVTYFFEQVEAGR